MVGQTREAPLTPIEDEIKSAKDLGLLFVGTFQPTQHLGFYKHKGVTVDFQRIVSWLLEGDIREGGVTLYLTTLCNSFARSGYQTHILTFYIPAE